MTLNQIGDCPDKENFSMEQMACTLKEKRKTKVNSARENSADEAVGMKNTKKDERIRLMEEKKLKKEVIILVMLVNLYSI